MGHRGELLENICVGQGRGKGQPWDHEAGLQLEGTLPSESSMVPIKKSQVLLKVYTVQKEKVNQ
jgi:hypothetical protein